MDTDHSDAMNKTNTSDLKSNSSIRNETITIPMGCTRSSHQYERNHLFISIWT